MKEYDRKENDYLFEKQYCYENPETFINEALVLRYSAEVLFEYEDLKTRHLFGENTGITIFSSDLVNKGCFNYRVIRMLFSYSLENLLKCIIVQNYKKDFPTETEVPIKEIDNHDLKKLYKKADRTFPDEYGLFLDSWTKCSVWAGRYPLPKKPNQMYQSRETTESSKSIRTDLLKISFGKLDQIVEKDVLLTNIGSLEYSAYKGLFDSLHMVTK